MSTKHSHRKKNLQLSYSVFFNLVVTQPDGKLRKIRARLSMETLSQDEKDRVNDNVEDIAAQFYEALAPHLNLDAESLGSCEKRKLSGFQENFGGDV